MAAFQPATEIAASGGPAGLRQSTKLRQGLWYRNAVAVTVPYETPTGKETRVTNSGYVSCSFLLVIPCSCVALFFDLRSSRR
eukprot:1434180-Prymnesium_polylepis.1